MKLKTQIDHELNRFSQTRDGLESRRTFGVAVDGGRLECTLTTVDTLACVFESVALRTDRLTHASPEQLRSFAKSLESRLGYLLEQIRPVETDEVTGAVQMRSQPPVHDADGITYFELLVENGEIRLSRYCQPADRTRNVVPATITREVLHRLARDLTCVVNE